MIIYISHPYGGKEANKKKIEAIINKLVKDNPDNIYVSAVHTFGFMYDAVGYEQGLDMCLELLNLCNMMYVYGEYQNSVGCRAEMQHCKQNRIPFKIMKY